MSWLLFSFLALLNIMQLSLCTRLVYHNARGQAKQSGNWTTRRDAIMIVVLYTTNIIAMIVGVAMHVHGG